MKENMKSTDEKCNGKAEEGDGGTARGCMDLRSCSQSYILGLSGSLDASWLP